MEETNVNKLNGVPNFGHGEPEKAVEPKEVVKEVTEVVEEVTKKRGRPKKVV